MPKLIREYNKLSADLRGVVPELNDLDGKEWAQRSRSINTYDGPIAEKRRFHGAAFPPSLAEHYIKIYTQKGDLVMDPFTGVGTTADAAEMNERKFVGFEINRKFYRLAKRGIDRLDANYFEYLPKKPGERTIFNKSCQQLEHYVKPESVSLTLTSPPYANLLRKIASSFAAYTYSKNIYKGKGRALPRAYTSKREDFGNMSLDEYAVTIEALMQSTYRASKPGSYNVWVVRDYREMTAHLPYVNLHSKIVELAGRVGWILNDIVIWDQTRQRHLVKLGGKICRRFYFNIGHSYILCFRKNLPGERFKNGY